MAKKLHKIDLLEILDGMVRSDVFEGLAEDTKIERKALIGAALSQLGSEITADAKSDGMHCYRGIISRQKEGRVSVDYVPSSKPVSLDTAAVKKEFPESEFPQYYKETNKTEYIKFTIGPRVPPDEAAADAAEAQSDPVQFMPAADDTHRDADGVLWSGPPPPHPEHDAMTAAAEAELAAAGIAPDPHYVDPAAEARAEALETEMLADGHNPDTAAALRQKWEQDTAVPCQYCTPAMQCYLCAEMEIAEKHEDIHRQLFEEFRAAAIAAGNDPGRVARAVALAQDPGGMQRAKTTYLTNALACQCPDAQKHRRDDKCKHQLAYIMAHNLTIQLEDKKAGPRMILIAALFLVFVVSAIISHNQRRRRRRRRWDNMKEL